MDASRTERANPECEDPASWWGKVHAGTILGYEGEPQHLPGGETRYEVGSREPLILPFCPTRSVAIELPGTPRIEVIDGAEVPQLYAAKILVQPEVLRQDWRRGWTPVGGEAWDDEVSFAEETSLDIGDLGGGDVSVVVEAEFLALERAGQLPVFVIIADHG